MSTLASWIEARDAIKVIADLFGKPCTTLQYECQSQSAKVLTLLWKRLKKKIQTRLAFITDHGPYSNHELLKRKIMDSTIPTRILNCVKTLLPTCILQGEKNIVLMRTMYHVPIRCVIEKTIVLEGESRQMSNINYLKGFLVFMLHFFFLRLNFRDISLAIAIATSSSRFLFFSNRKIESVPRARLQTSRSRVSYSFFKNIRDDDFNRTW